MDTRRQFGDTARAVRHAGALGVRKKVWRTFDVAPWTLALRMPCAIHARFDKRDAAKFSTTRVVVEDARCVSALHCSRGNSGLQHDLQGRASNQTGAYPCGLC